MINSFMSKTNEKVNVRQLEAKDAKQVLEYICTVGGETDNLLFGREGLGISVDEEMRILSQYLVHPVSMLLGCFIGEKLVAVANISVKERQRIRHIASLGISVIREYWNQGIGTYLMKYMIDYSRENEQIEVIELEVRSDNYRAVELYKSLGFKVIGTMPKAIKIGNSYHENLMMILEL